MTTDAPFPRSWGASREALTGHEHGCLDRIMVVARAIPRGRVSHADRWVEQLLTGLSGVVPETRLTLVALDGHEAQRFDPQCPGRRIEMAAGPQDWEAWFSSRALLFSHILITDLPSLRQLDLILRETQPQARRILCLPSLDFHGASTAGEDATGQDAAGARLVAHHVQNQLILAAESSSAIWCATPEDRAWFAAAVPRVPCHVLPTEVLSAAADVPFEQRSGYVVLATPGADVIAGHADAALHAARQMLPALLARDPTTFLRVVVDDPSPALQLLADRNIELVPAGADPARWFRRSRVCLAWYQRGTGSRDAIALAIESNTPFVTSGVGFRDHALERLPAAVFADDVMSACLSAGHLHARQRLWEQVQEDLVRLAHSTRSSAFVRLKLLRACADLGIAPDPCPILFEPAKTIPEEGQELRFRTVAVAGSAWKSAPVASNGTGPRPATSDVPTADVSVNEQYERWCARYGPSADRLERLGRRLRGLVRRPKLSLIMTVLDTEPSWLDEAISSIRAQVYEHWQLCLGVPACASPTTTKVLEAHLAQDRRIQMDRLPDQVGVAAAHNRTMGLARGAFIGFLKACDELKPDALGEVALLLDDQPDLDIIYTDEDKRQHDGALVDPVFKPGWSPDHLMSRNYIGDLLMVSRRVLDVIQGFRAGYDGSESYDLVLRATEVTDRIAHIPRPLHTRRKVPNSDETELDSGARDAGRRALEDALDRRGTPGEVVAGIYPRTYRTRYALCSQPKVSILIPTRDKVELLRRCVDSILERSTYSNYEIVVVDNQSTHPDTMAYLAAFPGRVLRYPHSFNYSRMMNLAAHEATGDMLLFLNNDTEVISPEWLETLIEHGQRPEIGVVGTRLLFPSGQPQHEGTIVGFMGGYAANVDHAGYWGLGDIVRDCSAVTGACLLTRPAVYWGVGGHDEKLRVAFNDVDLCLRVRQAGYRVVYTPYAELFHVEGGTRGIHSHLEDDAFFEDRWVTHKCQDPYYNPNFDRLHPFRLRS